MEPLSRYQQDLEQQKIQPDKAQQLAVNALQQRYQQLQVAPPSFWQRLVLRKKPQQVPGLYMWGGVGRGKTYLMDVFHESLKNVACLRLHFHHLMQRVHQLLEQEKGHSDPMARVAATIADRYRVLCLDEFFVADIADAMLLAGLLDGLFSRGVTLITTSNIPPEKLYENGLQRARFLPAIALLQQYTEIMNVDGGVDHRQRSLTATQCFLTPVTLDTDAQLEALFNELSSARGVEDKPVTVLGRTIMARREAPGIAYFDFSQLCEGPRSQHDYIELARSYHTLLIRDIPILDGRREDAARRFLMLIDELYDRRVKLMGSFRVALSELYQGEQLQFEFVRCLSRLQEMQSAEYLAESHRLD